METILVGFVQFKDHHVVNSPTKVEYYHQQLRI